MAINFMDTVQIQTVLNEIVKQAAGERALAAVNTSDFVAVAKVGLEAGYDKLATAMTQLLSRTLYVNRAYSEKLRLLDADTMQYGNHVRKIQFLDDEWEENEAYKLEDGQSVDMYEVHKPKVFQDNFYGTVTAQRMVTIYRDQLRQAMTGPAEFGNYYASLMQNLQDQIAMKTESLKRSTLANLIGGTMSTGVTSQVIHLVTEYNAAIGSPATPLTLSDLLAPDAFEPFARWIFGRLSTLSKALTDRTVIYHQNPTTATPISGYIHRHTPASDQKMVLYSPFFDRVDANVMTTSFNDEYLKLAQHEFVNYWQSAAEPQAINVKASYTTTAGAVATADIDTDLVIGIVFDREAAGVTLVGDELEMTPYNPRGKYWNVVADFEARYYNDNFENAVVLVLD